MTENIDVPKIGKIKKPYVYGAVGAAALFVGYRYWMAAKSAGDSAPTIEYAAADAPVAGGSYVNPDPNAPVDTNAGPSITTNPQWSAAATDALVSVGYDSTFVGATIGKYLGKQALTQDEAALIRTALAYVGSPPVGSYNVLLVGTGPTTTTPPPPAGYKGPAKRKTSWPNMGSAGVSRVRPNLANFEQILLYYYDNVAPTGPIRYAQVKQLASTNGYKVTGSTFKYDKKKTINLPATLG